MKSTEYFKYYITNANDRMMIKNIDFEEVILKHLPDGYEIEISGYEKSKINLYLWQNFKLKATILNGNRDCYRDYENFLKGYCIKGNKEIRLDFKNKTIDIVLEEEEF